jgi:hypothetical protein
MILTFAYLPAFHGFWKFLGGVNYSLVIGLSSTVLSYVL